MELAVIENEALKLSQTDRALLADRLLGTLGTLDTRITQAWAEEGERRLELFRAGQISAAVFSGGFRSRCSIPETNRGSSLPL